MFGRGAGTDGGGALDALARRVAELEARTPEHLARRVDELEERCRGLADAVRERDEALERLRREQRILAVRIDEGEAQARKAAGGLIDRIEAVRRQARPAGAAIPA